jgi:hypothetical protein
METGHPCIPVDRAATPPSFLWYKPMPMDRRLAQKNLRTALIAGAISLIVFALSFFAGLVY